jgi:DNA-binding IclR family transcriptional regulator
MQREGSHLYAIGPLAYELGLVAAQQFDIRALCRPVMERLAAESTEAVYFVQRSGPEAVCIDVIEGCGTARILTLQPGSRRPLGLGAGGLAILSGLPSEEREEILLSVAGVIERYWRIPEEEIRHSMKEMRGTGFAVIRNTITPGVTAIGRSFRNSLNQVFGALTIAGLSGRMSVRRLQSLRQSLERATASVEKVLRSHQWSRYSTTA